MPRTIDAALLTTYQSRASTLTTCWKITRTDNVVVGFTSHTKDLEVDSVDYYAKTGYQTSAISNNNALSVDNLDVEGVARELDALIYGPQITEADIRAGVYDYAEVLFFEVDYTAPANGINILKRGNLGELTLKDGIHVTQIRALAQRLARIFVRVTQPDCDAELYDTRCGISPTAFTNTGSISLIVTDRLTFTVTLDAPARAVGYFNDALITFTSGEANGRSMEVFQHDTGDDFTLFLRSPYLLQIGDTFSVQRGCDRKPATCKTVFDNFINFRGFPVLPGRDKVLRYPDAKASDSGGKK